VSIIITLIDHLHCTCCFFPLSTTVLSSGELALSRGQLDLAADCLDKAKDMSGLLLLAAAKVRGSYCSFNVDLAPAAMLPASMSEQIVWCPVPW
jgi:hypothetical protein